MPSAAAVGEIDPSSGLTGTLVLDARLALVDPSNNTDKYYIIQVVKSDIACAKQYACWQRWGRTGTGGQASTTAGDLATTRAIFEAKGAKPSSHPKAYQWLAVTSNGVNDKSKGFKT